MSYTTRLPKRDELEQLMWPYAEMLSLGVNEALQHGVVVRIAARLGQARIVEEDGHVAGFLVWLLCSSSYKGMFMDWDIDKITHHQDSLNKGDYCFIPEIMLSLSEQEIFKVTRQAIRDTGAETLAFCDRRRRWREIPIRQEAA